MEIKKTKMLRFKKKLGKKYSCRIFLYKGISFVEGVLSSYYGVHAMTEILETIPKEHYVLCPLYGGGDFQIGVTGGFGEDEKWTVATSRELKEEIGLYPNPRSEIGNFKEAFNGTKEKTWYVSEIDFKDIKFVPKEKNNTKMDVLGNTKKRLPYKIACLVHGLKSDMEKYASSEIYRYKSEDDDIIGVVFVPVKEALNLVYTNYY